MEIMAIKKIKKQGWSPTLAVILEGNLECTRISADVGDHPCFFISL